MCISICFFISFLVRLGLQLDIELGLELGVGFYIMLLPDICNWFLLCFQFTFIFQLSLCFYCNLKMQAEEVLSHCVLISYICSVFFFFGCLCPLFLSINHVDLRDKKKKVLPKFYTTQIEYLVAPSLSITQQGYRLSFSSCENVYRGTSILTKMGLRSIHLESWEQPYRLQKPLSY